MITGSLSEWATAMDGKLLGPDGHFAGVSTDSRSQARGALFFALRGEHFDGADFLSAAISGGATGAVLSRPLPEDVPQIIVKDTRGALADCARTWRRRFAIPVVGVTGSNGKTTVKELTASILRAQWGGAGRARFAPQFQQRNRPAFDAAGTFPTRTMPPCLNSAPAGPAISHACRESRGRRSAHC